MSSFLAGLLLALQTLHLGSPLSSLLTLSPRRPTVTTIITHREDTSPLSGATDLPIGLTVHVTRAQLRTEDGLDGLDILYTNTVRVNGSSQIRLRLHALLHRHSGHVKLAAIGRIARVRELLLLVENNSDEAALGMLLGVEVIANVTSLRGINGVVPAHTTVFTGEPERSALAEDDTSWNHVFTARALCSETLAGGITGVSIGCSLRGV